MLENNVRYCDYCKQPLTRPGKWMQIKIESIDERIFQQTLTSLEKFGFAFEQQADGSVTLDSCTECQDLFMKFAEEHQESKLTNLMALEGSLFQRRRYELGDPDECCGCGAAFPQGYDAYVTTAGPERWICRDCFDEFRDTLGFRLQ